MNRHQWHRRANDCQFKIKCIVWDQFGHHSAFVFCASFHGSLHAFGNATRDNYLNHCAFTYIRWHAHNRHFVCTNKDQTIFHSHCRSMALAHHLIANCRPQSSTNKHHRKHYSSYSKRFRWVWKKMERDMMSARVGEACVCSLHFSHGLNANLNKRKERPSFRLQ